MSGSMQDWPAEGHHAQARSPTFPRPASRALQSWNAVLPVHSFASSRRAAGLPWPQKGRHRPRVQKTPVPDKEPLRSVGPDSAVVPTLPSLTAPAAAWAPVRSAESRRHLLKWKRSELCAGGFSRYKGAVQSDQHSPRSCTANDKTVPLKGTNNTLWTLGFPRCPPAARSCGRGSVCVWAVRGDLPASDRDSCCLLMAGNPALASPGLALQWREPETSWEP